MPRLRLHGNATWSGWPRFCHWRWSRDCSLNARGCCCTGSQPSLSHCLRLSQWSLSRLGFHIWFLTQRSGSTTGRPSGERNGGVTFHQVPRASRCGHAVNKKPSRHRLGFSWRHSHSALALRLKSFRGGRKSSRNANILQLPPCCGWFVQQETRCSEARCTSTSPRRSN